jgi:hypothetical protein
MRDDAEHRFVVREVNRCVGESVIKKEREAEKCENEQDAGEQR